MASSSRICLSVLFILSVLAIAGCGSSNSAMTPPRFSGNTVVSLLLTSTANDHLSQLALNFTSITLTSQSGKTVTLLAAPQNAEFLHLNGNIEPFATATIPQDIYVSATADINGNSIVCIDLNSTGGLEGNFGIAQLTPTNSATINFPAPITVTGAHMGLVLDLLVSQSVSYPSCDTVVQGPTTLTPTFTLTTLTFAAQPTNAEDGLASDMEGVVSTVNSMARSFQVTSGDGIPWTLNTSGATIFQGIPDFSGIVAGTPVDLDAAIQSDGSLLATRVAVPDTNTASLSISSGPVLQVASSQPSLASFGDLQEGPLTVRGTPYYNFGNAIFAISGQLANLSSLPFAATFTGTNMVPGQRVLFTAHSPGFPNSPAYPPATTMMLLPQTINGTVTAVSNEGGFATYTIGLAPYDLFSDLAVQAGQLTLLQNPNTVVVYVDSSVQMLNAKPLAVGSTLRFYGLVFNDNGTLKMDCAQITDGVSQ